MECEKINAGDEEDKPVFFESFFKKIQEIL